MLLLPWLCSGAGLCGQLGYAPARVTGRETLEAPNGPLRIVLKVSKAENGGWSAVNTSIDQGGGGQ